MVFLGGPWSPFENNWHLKEEFKRSNKRLDLANKLSQQITYIAIVYICMSPLVFFWELMVFFCSYGDVSIFLVCNNIVKQCYKPVFFYD